MRHRVDICQLELQLFPLFEIPLVRPTYMAVGDVFNLACSSSSSMIGMQLDLIEVDGEPMATARMRQDGHVSFFCFHAGTAVLVREVAK
jgi:hypothetical protein